MSGRYRGLMCGDCIHGGGDCVGLSHCGGEGFQSRYIECDLCGDTFDGETATEFEGDFLCPKCAKTYERQIAEGGAE